MAVTSKRQSRRRGGARKNVLLLQALNDHVYRTGEGQLDSGPLQLPDTADITKKMWYESLQNGPNKKIYEQLNFQRLQSAEDGGSDGLGGLGDNGDLIPEMQRPDYNVDTEEAGRDTGAGEEAQ